MAQPELIDKPKRWRRIGWYSLVVIVLTLIGLYAFAFWRCERQQAAIAEIERLGGTVQIEKGGPEWLRRMVGDERMKVVDRVVYVSLYGGPSDRAVAIYRSLGMDYDQTQIADDDLRHLSVLSSLERFGLINTQITDDGLRYFSGLTNLEELNLSGSQITDDGLRHLSDLTNLNYLNVSDTQITDEGEKMLQKALPQCDIHRHVPR